MLVRLGLAMGLSLPMVVQAPTDPPPAEAPTIVERYLARAVRTPRTYQAKRRLEANNPRFRKTGWIEVLTELQEGKFTFTITARGGSEMVQNRVLIPVLEAERDLAGEDSSFEISEKNYVLSAAPPTDDGLARIRLQPRRKDKRLLDGFLVLTPEADVVEITGRLAKSPSFWTTSVTITRRYGYINGVRVPLSVTSVADLRLAGKSTFSMTYEFLTIDGVAVAGKAQ